MNERIRKLALETDVWCDQNWAGYEFYNIRWEEKFAELIVRECIEHLEGNVAVPNLEHSITKTKCIRSIKEHFGVEE